MSEFNNLETHIKEAERIGEEIAKAYDKGFTEKLKNANSSIVKAFNQRYKAIGYQHEYGLITDEEYYKKLEQARDRYFSRDTQEWHKYTEEIYNYRKSALEEYQSYVEKNLENLLKTIDANRLNYKEKLLDFAGGTNGFDKHEYTIKNYWPNGSAYHGEYYTLTDYEKEIEKLIQFNDAITKLKERAADIDSDVFSMFFDQLKSMSAGDASILTDLLLKANDKDFKEHFELYEARNTLAENMATSYFADDYKKAAEEMRNELEQMFGELPTDFFEHGQNVAESFVDGFITELDKLFLDFTIEIPQIESGVQNNNVENTTFSPVYYIIGEDGKISRTRINAKNDALFNYMRGIQ